MAEARKKRSGRRAGSIRTCCGCRKRLLRGAGLRLVRDPGVDEKSAGRLLPDLYGKLPGRGVHVCPDLACIQKAAQQPPSRAMRARVNIEDATELASAFLHASDERIKSLLASSLRSGWLFAGRTPVKDALQRGRVALLLLARDASAGLSGEMQRWAQERGIPCLSLFSVEEMSRFHRGKPLAVMGVRHRGIARRLAEEIQKASTLSESMKQWSQRPRSKLTAISDRGKMPQQRGARAGSESDRS